MRFNLNKLSSKKNWDFFLSKSFVLLICLLLASTFSAFAQTKSISGTITDETKESLIGVSVRIKGTTTGTVSDIDGKYTISANQGDILEFTFIGMNAQEITVGTKDVIDVVLTDNATLLTETVVIGYGVSKKADLTGSIGNVGADQIMKQPTLNAVQAVQGKLSGVNVVANDAPGSMPTVTIRGMGTALGGRNPLYIVDGFPVDNIRNINSSDILSMDILKDASSASIYGVRAANGVILITTKKGESGSTKIGVESYFGVKTILNKVKMANASQYVTFFNENQTMLKAYGANDTYLLKDASQQTYDTDWYDELIRTGLTTNTTVSLSGGSKVVDYYFSYNYFDEKGILDGQSYQRNTIRNNNVYKFFNDRLKFNQNLSVSFANENPKPSSAFNNAYRQSPLVPTRFGNGRYGKSFVNTATGIAGYEGNTGEKIGNLNSIGNPLQTRDEANDRTKDLTVQGGIEAEFKLTDFLKVNSRFGATQLYYKNRQFRDSKETWLEGNPTRTEEEFEAEKAKNPANTQYANNSLRFEDVNTFRWIWEGYATFSKKFDRHNFEAVVGTSREKSGIGSTSILKGYEVPSRSQYWNLGMVSGNYAPEINQYSYTPRALASYFGRIQYNFDSRYYVSATVRRDGSSTFKSNKEHWATFPSIGLGWTISNENFMKDVAIIDHLKLKGTWGKLGNQDVPLNVSQIMTKPGSSDYNYVFGPTQALIYGAAFGTAALDISWEVTRELGFGLDFSMLDQRLSGGIDYYDKTNTNTILKVTPVLNTVDEEDFYAHGAKVSNKGIELSLGWNDKFANGLSYEISANYSYNKNEVKNVTDTYNGARGGSLGDGEITKRLQQGQPIYAWWMYEADGIWQSQEEIDATDAKLGSPKPGHIKYKDANGDGMIDERDKQYFGSFLPTSNFGIHLGFGYKNFDLSIDGYGVAGNKVYNGLKHGRVNGGENITEETFKNRWTGTGSTNAHPGANRDSYSSSYFLEDGSFFRVNNITLGYTFEDLVFKGSNLRFYFTAQNPFIITGYSGFSPEIGSDGEADRLKSNGDPSKTTGVELSAYPATRNFIMGLNLQF